MSFGHLNIDAKCNTQPPPIETRSVVASGITLTHTYTYTHANTFTSNPKIIAHTHMLQNIQKVSHR